MWFRNYDEACITLVIPLGITPISIIDDPRTLESISNQGRIIRVVGCGHLISPGRPGRNQNLEDQRAFRLRFYQYRRLPVFYCTRDGVMFLGLYSLAAISKKISENGFTYYEYKMHREIRPTEVYKLYGLPNLSLGRQYDDTPPVPELETHDIRLVDGRSNQESYRIHYTDKRRLI